MFATAGSGHAMKVLRAVVLRVRCLIEPALFSSCPISAAWSLTLSRAVAFTLSPSADTGLCRPGVSTNTSWASSSVRMPITRVRVVCGLSETMLTFCPHIALTSVLLPTFGRPTRVMNPLRMRRSTYPRGAFTSSETKSLRDSGSPDCTTSPDAFGTATLNST